MSIAIRPADTIADITKPAEAPKVSDGGDLGESFAQAFKDARTYQEQATTSSEQFAAGNPNMGIHEVMIASEKASISLRYATTLKNKVLEAYRDLMNTQV
jgi:flagellar hook-basal body complex protein FliE|nr:flagellar hook-basal body complex protein FliE [Kofleriaceae bacterium]